MHDSYYELEEQMHINSIFYYEKRIEIGGIVPSSMLDNYNEAIAYIRNKTITNILNDKH